MTAMTHGTTTAYACLYCTDYMQWIMDSTHVHMHSHMYTHVHNGVMGVIILHYTCYTDTYVRERQSMVSIVTAQQINNTVSLSVMLLHCIYIDYHIVYCDQ